MCRSMKRRPSASNAKVAATEASKIRPAASKGAVPRELCGTRKLDPNNNADKTSKPHAPMHDEKDKLGKRGSSHWELEKSQNNFKIARRKAATD